MMKHNRLEETDYLLRSVWQRYQQYLLLEDKELSAHQVYFLHYLAKHQTCTPSEIAQEFGITLGAVTGFVDRLYKLELISRERSEQDRRLVLIGLTDKGRELMQGFAAERDQRYARIMASLGEEQIDRLNGSLRAMKSAIDKLLDGE